MSLMKAIAAYDREREARILALEEEVEDLKGKIREMQDEELRRAEASSQTILKNIMDGVYDNVRPKPVGG